MLQLSRLVLVVCLLTAVACSSGEHPGSAAPKPSATGTTKDAAHRKPTKPKEPELTNEALGYTHHYVAWAIHDLKKIDLWHPLTDHLFAINLDSRLGPGYVPPDGHLADAYFGALVDMDGNGGARCDIMFFADAIKDDLQRWTGYYSQGLIDEAPPGNLRQFYGSLLAHELGHCQRGKHGEHVAEEWESKARDLLREAHI